jgi:hypothetical protein
MTFTTQIKKIGVGDDLQRIVIDKKTYLIFSDYVAYYEYSKYLPKLFHAKVPALTYFRDDPYPVWLHSYEPPLVSATELTDLLDPKEGHILAEATKKFQEPEGGKFSSRVIMIMGFAGVIIFQIIGLYFSVKIKDIVESIMALAKLG